MYINKNNKVISAHANGGPRSPSAHAWPLARPPISMSGNFSAHVSAGSPSNISLTPQKSYTKFQNPRTTFENFKIGFQNFGYDFWGVGRDVWRWLCRHMRRKISAYADGGRANGQVCTDGERGPPSGWGEIWWKFFSNEKFIITTNHG